MTTTRFVEKWVDEAAGLTGPTRGKGEARETPIGVPTPGALHLSGLDIPAARLEAALRCDRDEWFEALDELRGFYEQFGPRLPAPLWEAHAQTARRLRG